MLAFMDEDDTFQERDPHHEKDKKVDTDFCNKFEDDFDEDDMAPRN